MSRKVFRIVFLTMLTLMLGVKAAQQGWFAARLPLELDGEPALLFFNKARGCECELLVYSNARAQMDVWQAPVRIINIDVDRRLDLAQLYKVLRAPTLILLDAEGQTVWTQVESLSDEAPLDLNQAERQIEKLAQNP